MNLRFGALLLASGFLLGAAGRPLLASGPFTVEMYVKSPQPTGNYQKSGPGPCVFAGTRTINEAKSDAGWCMGLTGHGRVQFVVADGTNRSYAFCLADTSRWVVGEWNHVAVRMTDKGTLDLFINGFPNDRAASCGRKYYAGTANTNASCVAAVDLRRETLSGKEDPCSGKRFPGETYGWQFHGFAMSEDQIMVSARRLGRLRSMDADAGLVPDEAGIEVRPPEKFSAPLTIQPVPQQMDVSTKWVPIPLPITVVTSDVAFAETAAATFKSVCGKTLGCTNVVLSAVAPSSGTVLVLEKSAFDRKEAYGLEGGREGQGERSTKELLSRHSTLLAQPATNLYRLRLTAADHAFFYGVDTLRQLLRKGALERGVLSLPERFSIRDWPLMPVRASLGIGPSHGNWAGFFEGMALGRLNAVAMSRSSWKEEKDISAFCAVAARYGVGVVGCPISYRLDMTSFSDEKSLAEYRERIHTYGRAGVRGLNFMFDDLRDKAHAIYTQDPALRAKYPSESAFHNALVHYGLDEAAAYPNLTNLLVVACPSYYWHKWGEEGRKYLKDFAVGFKARNVLVSHCVFSAREVAELKADGAETYGFYLNGLWLTSEFFRIVTGPDSLCWSWYLWHADRNGIGPCAIPEAIEEMRHLHERSPVFWAATASCMGRAAAGIFSWNPPAYDALCADRVVCDRMLGEGVFDAFKEYESAVLPIVGLTQPFSISQDLYSQAPHVARRTGFSRKEMLGYERNYRAAESAYVRMRQAIAAQTNAVMRPYGDNLRTVYVREVRKALRHLRLALDVANRLPEDWRESRDCESGEATWVRRIYGKDAADALKQVLQGKLWREPPRVVIVDLDSGSLTEELRQAVLKTCPAARVLAIEEATQERIDEEIRKGVDVPRNYRLGYQLQVTRGRVPKQEHVADIVGLLSKLGYDQLQLYMEDHYPYERNPGVSAGDAAIRPDEWKALDALAKSQGIELVPSQESFGHLDAWMTHPDYRHLAEKPEGDIVLARGTVRKNPSCLCPTDEKSLAFVLSLWDELLPNFTSGLFNIGCDEVVDIEGVTGRSGAAIAQRGSVPVYVDFLNKLIAAANARGKTAMFWGDMIAYTGEGALSHWQMLRPGCIVLNWDYEGSHAGVYDRRYELMRQAGRRVYSCPGTSGWSTIAGRTQNMMDNVDAHLSAGLKHGAEGMLLTDWGGGPQPQPFLVSVPAIVYCAERVRKGRRPDFAELAVAVDAAVGAKVGEALVRYGNLYRLCGKRKSDGSELFSVLTRGREYVRSPGVSDMSLDAVAAEYADAKRTRDLAGAPDWVKDEMAAVELMLDALVLRIRGEHEKVPAFAPKYEELWRRGYREGKCRVAGEFLFHEQ